MTILLTLWQVGEHFLRYQVVCFTVFSMLISDEYQVLNGGTT
jgi:hypothetical protein